MKTENFKTMYLGILFIILLCTFLNIDVEAKTYTGTIEVEYDQTEARKMLNMINNFMTGDNAWEWNSSNTKKVYHNNLKKLTYDYNLEKIAMQRAAEIAISFAHERPNGKSCFTAYSSGYNYKGENIAAGYTSANKVFTGWCETDEKYAGQGHRRNMLKSNYTSVGIGHVVYNGFHFWVQEFGDTNLEKTKTTAVDYSKNMSISLTSSKVNSVKSKILSITLDKEESYNLDEVRFKVALDELWPDNCTALMSVPCIWKSNDTSIVKVSDNKVVGVNAGSTSIYTTVFGKKVIIPVSVKGITLELSKSTFSFTGKLQRPTVSVNDGDGNVIDSVYYSIDFSGDCKSVGSHTVIVTMTGDYTGTLKQSFSIIPVATSIKSLKAATKAITVKWNKKTTQVSGYQIQYSTSSKFTTSTTKTVTIKKNSTVSKKISSLKAKKKYYIRVRTFKSVKEGDKSVRYYSNWSAKKNIKTK